MEEDRESLIQKHTDNLAYYPQNIHENVILLKRIYGDDATKAYQDVCDEVIRRIDSFNEFIALAEEEKNEVRRRCNY